MLPILYIFTSKRLSIEIQIRVVVLHGAIPMNHLIETLTFMNRLLHFQKNRYLEKKFIRLVAHSWHWKCSSLCLIWGCKMVFSYLGFTSLCGWYEAENWLEYKNADFYKCDASEDLNLRVENPKCRSNFSYPLSLRLKWDG